MSAVPPPGPDYVFTVATIDGDFDLPLDTVQIQPNELAGGTVLGFDKAAQITAVVSTAAGFYHVQRRARAVAT